jgi:hypothetical protein
VCDRSDTTRPGRAVGLSLDADTARPGGLLRGVTALSAKAGGGAAAAAFAEDAKTLIDALTAAGGGADFVFVCAPSTATAAKEWASAKFDVPILSSSAIAKNSIIAVEVGAFVSAFLPVPEFTVSMQAVIAQDDAPTQQIFDGSGNPAAGITVRSLYQSDAIALRTVCRCAWAMRLVAKIDSVIW